MYQSYKKIEFNDLNYNGALNTQFFFHVEVGIELKFQMHLGL
jgi:hypothetical protein